MSAAELSREALIEHDEGYLVNEHGEIVGTVDASEDFRVTDQASAEWVLNKMLEQDAAMEAVESTAAVIHARQILMNAAALKQRHKRKLDWLHTRFDKELEEWARPVVEATKKRSLRTLYGSIVFRVQNGGVRVKSALRAVEWAKRHAPQAVRVSEEFLISQLTAEQLQLIRNRMDVAASLATGSALMKEVSLVRDAFDIEPPSEKCDIKPGSK